MNDTYHLGRGECNEERVPRHFYVASGGYETQIRIHNQDAQLVHTLQFPDVQVLHIAFSGQQSARANERLLLAVGGSPKIGVYDISPDMMSPAPFYLYDMHQAAITAVGFEPNASEFLYSSSEDGTLQVWVPVTQQHPVDLAQQHQGARPRPPRNTLRTFYNRGSSTNLVAINDVVFHHRQMLYFAVDAVGRLRVWNHNQSSNEGLMCEHIPHKSRRHLQCIDMSADLNMVVMANLDGLVFIYNVDDLFLDDAKAVPAIIQPSGSYVTRVRLSYSTNLLACPLTSGIKVFRMRDIALKEATPITDDMDVEEAPNSEVQKVAPVQLFGDRPGWIWDASFVGDSEDYLVACSSNTTVRLWDLKNFSNSREFPPSKKAVVCLAVKEFLADIPEVTLREPEVHAIPPPNLPINNGTHASYAAST